MKRYKMEVVGLEDVMRLIKKANTFPAHSLKLVDKAGNEIFTDSLIWQMAKFDWSEFYLYTADMSGKVYDAFAEFVVE